MPVRSNSPLSIGPGFQQRGIANFFTTESGYAYIHLKTTVPQQSYVMPMVELIGYSYGTAQAVRVAFTFYTYSYLIWHYGGTCYNGVTQANAYISTDGYVVLVGYTGSSYFMGFSIDAYSVAGNGVQYEVGILAMAASNSISGVF
jgi:hypothetical protein